MSSACAAECAAARACAAKTGPSAAANDPVPDLPPANPVDWLDGSSHFGTNPAFPQFGARDFYINPRNPVSVTDPIGAHFQYWDVGSASLKNLAQITDGQYGQVQ